MVGHLEAIFMELLDLFPTHVFLFVLEVRWKFADEEGGGKTIFFEQWSDIGGMGGYAIVKGEDDGFVGDGLEGLGVCGGEQYRQEEEGEFGHTIS